MGYIKTGDKDLLLGGLIALGVPAAQANAMNINQVQAAFSDGAAFLDQSAQGTKDVMVDVTATGAGWTPIVGININPSEELNIGLKYEHKTALVLTNETREGDGYSDAGMAFLKNNQKVSSDLPGIVTAGLDYKVTDRFLTSLSFNTYLDKGVDWGVISMAKNAISIKTPGNWLWVCSIICSTTLPSASAECSRQRVSASSTRAISVTATPPIPVLSDSSGILAKVLLLTQVSCTRFTKITTRHLKDTKKPMTRKILSLALGWPILFSNNHTADGYLFQGQEMNHSC